MVKLVEHVLELVAAEQQWEGPQGEHKPTARESRAGFFKSLVRAIQYYKSRTKNVR